MKKPNTNEATPHGAPVMYTDSEGKAVVASTANPLPINIQAAIGAFTTPWKLNYSDIKTNAVKEYNPGVSLVYRAVIIPDEIKLYDNDILTYSPIWYVSSPTYAGPVTYNITLNVPQFVNSVILVAKDTYNDAKFGNLHLAVLYEDSTVDTLSPTIYNINTLDYPFYVIVFNGINKTKRALSIILSSHKISDLGATLPVNQRFDCYGLYIYVNPHEVDVDLLSNIENINNNIDTTLSSRASEATLSTISGNIDVALSSRASEATLQSVLAQLDVALSTRASETTLSNLKNDIDPTPDKYIDDLTLSGSYTAGTYTATYTPASGEIVFIDNLNFSSLLGEGRLRLYWGTNIIAEANVYYRANLTSSVNVRKKIVGDGTTALTLELYVLTSTIYFGKANMWRCVT